MQGFQKHMQVVTNQVCLALPVHITTDVLLIVTLHDIANHNPPCFLQRPHPYNTTLTKLCCAGGWSSTASSR